MAAKSYLPTLRGLWIAAKGEAGDILTIYHTSKLDHNVTTVYTKSSTEQLHLIASNQPLPPGQYNEVRIARCIGAKRTIMDFNPCEIDDSEFTLWMWGKDWICNLGWDPNEWQWR